MAQASAPAVQAAETSRPLLPRAITGYGASLLMVAAAALAAWLVEQIIPAPNLSLVFVLPVIVAAAAYGWGPSLTAALAGVAVFDFYFVEPRFTLAVASPTDLWAMALLLVVAAIVSTVAAESRGRALAARRAADQAEALHALAHAIVNAGPPAALLRAAAGALSRSFGAPAVVLEYEGGKLVTRSADGGGRPAEADLDAARWVAENRAPSRAETYPFDQSAFDFWPAATAAGRRLVLGVRFDSRPDHPERTVELVAGYLAAGSA